MSTARFAASLALLAVALTGTARAQEVDGWARPLVGGVGAEVLPLNLHTGAFAHAEVAPVRWAAAQVGVGVTAAQSPAGLAMLHLRLPFRRWAPGIEAGALFGPLTWGPGGTWGVGGGGTAAENFYREHIDFAVFSRVGATATHRPLDGATQFRIHVGVTSLLNRRHGYCSSTLPGHDADPKIYCPVGGIPSMLPYFGLELGFPFG